MDQQQIITKLAELEVIKTKLKREFVGIDDQINQIVDSIRTWYCFPETLSKPLIVNLWGITGTFKTSVLRRLVELLGKKQDFREIDARNLLSDSFKNLVGVENIYRIDEYKLPEIILIDEFQNIRTIDNFGQDVADSKKLHTLFSILSDGKAKEQKNSYGMVALTQLVKEIRENKDAIVKKVSIKHLEAKDRYYARLERDKNRITNSLNSTPVFKEAEEDDIPTFADSFWELHSFTLDNFKEFRYRVIESFKNDSEALFTFICDEFEKITPEVTIDLSKTLMFVAGNLDDIFSGLTHHLDNDSINADEFYEYSKNVNFNDVKHSLLYRFKPEQVSRLGTNHVIFPSFNNKMYKKFISNLNKRTLSKFKSQGIKIVIDKSVDEMLLKNGAVPSQGARSILSAHEFVVESNISELLALAILNGTKVAKLSVKNNHLVLEAKKEKVLKDISILDTKVLENYPEPLNSTICVHEIGHAMCVIALTGEYPDMIKVRSSDQNVGGYVKYSPSSLPNKQDLKNRLAISLGGYAAEYLEFGPDNVSSGASSDILNATSTASVMVKLLGFGDGMSASGFSMSRDGLVLNDTDRLDQEVDDLISEAFVLACTVLLFYKKERKILFNFIKNKTTMKKEEIKKILKM